MKRKNLYDRLEWLKNRLARAKDKGLSEQGWAHLRATLDDIQRKVAELEAATLPSRSP